MSGQLLDTRILGSPMGERTSNTHISNTHASKPDADIDSQREPSYCWEAAKSTADGVLFRATQQHLSDIECKVLEGAWQGKTYDQMAVDYGYSPEYLNKDVGNKLWRKLTAGLGERVGKRNFREALRRAWKDSWVQAASSSAVSGFVANGAVANGTVANGTVANGAEIPLQEKSLQKRSFQERFLQEGSLQEKSLQITNIPFPEGAVALTSPLYVQRADIEPRCYDAITQPGALLRIKAPALMGKTSLVNRILAQAQQQVGKVVYLDLTSCDRAFLSDLDKFLRRFCAMASQQLGLENQLSDRWDTDILGSNDNCTAYFEEYLLPAADGGLVVGIDECDRLFAYPEVAEDVLGMLRSWHEKGKVSALWQRLRLVIAHATDVYIPLDINQSPFNAGIPIELKPFDSAQIVQLAALHGLTLAEHEVQLLMDVVGGHPHLVRLALYQLSREQLSADSLNTDPFNTTKPRNTTESRLEALLESAASDSGFYSSHLRGQLVKLQQDSTLLSAFYQVVSEGSAAMLTTAQEYKLCSTGLLRREGNAVVTSCQLYQTYFSRVLSRERG